MKIENMFFELRYAALKGESFEISSDSIVIAKDAGYAEKYIVKVLNTLEGGVKTTIKLQNKLSNIAKNAAGVKGVIDDESYAVEIYDSEIILSSDTRRGLIYAVSTLWQLIQSGNLKKGIIFDYPDKKIRGYRVYTPGRETFKEFKEMVDMLVYYKYNYMIFEVGGAMEYKRRPEINKKWVEFCEEVHRGPYESDRIQFKTHPQWAKNSIHADNGNGSFITQDEMRSLIAYCNEREITVIPEVPSLSHSDYIVMTYPELNERVEDTYPDTYCPSNPKSYEVLFDIIDEVIDVFKPHIINIGHDEAYTFSCCPKCRDKSSVELYVGDIVRINDYLKSKNIKALMWSEKLFGETVLMDGNPVGGAAKPQKGIPALYPCRDKLPHDILMMNWYWSICREEEEKLVQDLGFEMIFGNFNGVNLNNYRERIDRVSGGFVSNWGSCEELYMQRNSQNFSVVGTAYTFWSGEYDTPQKEELIKKVQNHLYKRYKNTLGENPIEITHTTNLQINHKMFYDGYFVVDDEWYMGDYIVKYEGGKEAALPVHYGYNICFEGYDPISDTGTREATGASLPFMENGKTYYKTAFKNPYPELKIESISFKKGGKLDLDSFEVETV